MCVRLVNERNEWSVGLERVGLPVGHKSSPNGERKAGKEYVGIAIATFRQPISFLSKKIKDRERGCAVPAFSLRLRSEGDLFTS